ncbi:fimbrial protein StdA [Salmonella enterica subsp. enterica serovar Saintpaul]|nr:fimbrial protein StdA [Salmonella enterica subsp. enterica serovar Saintpaul]EHJ0807160.1 fimbrial protein [Salmonella enterica]ELS1936343.1 fimbrial protein [Salmonella enterica]
MRTKSLLTIALAAAGMMYGASVFATAPTTGPFGSGTITFTGTIINSPCDIKTGDITVPFGQISYRKLNEDNHTTDSIGFTIPLENCGFDTDDQNANKKLLDKATVIFSSDHGFDTGTNSFNNGGAADAAQNVGVQILENDNTTVITPDTPSTSHQLHDGANNLNFNARLIAVGAAATTGSINTQVIYTLKYL